METEQRPGLFSDWLQESSRILLDEPNPRNGFFRYAMTAACATAYFAIDRFKYRTGTWWDSSDM